MTTGDTFENRVRQAARSVWGDSAYAGRDVDNGREYDLRVETRTTIYLLEATTSTKLEKFRFDADKLHKRRVELRGKTDKSIQLTIVFDEEPSQHIIEDSRSSYPDIQVTTLDRLKRQAIDAQKYIDLRKSYRFGSSRSSDQANIHFDESKFVKPKFSRASDFNEFDSDSIASLILNPTSDNAFVILGGYGSGKSTYLRLLFKKLYTSYFNGKALFLPILLNLDEHKGQSNPNTALFDHATNVGYPHPEDLVRVWRTGGAILLLDGFDELSSLSYSYNNLMLKDHRRTATALVRNFIEQKPKSSIIVITGRDNYFDNLNETASSIGVSADFIYSLLDFDKRQVQALFKEHGHSEERIPAWLPTRPLLLSYFAAKSLADTTTIATLEPGEGWLSLIPMLSEREARLDIKQVPTTVTAIYGALGSLSRTTIDGLGRFTIDDFKSIFENLTGAPADQDAMQMMVRLAGTQESVDGSGARCFIDPDFADAMKSIEGAQAIQGVYQIPDTLDRASNKQECSLRDTLFDVYHALVRRENITHKQIIDSYKSMRSREKFAISSEIAALANKVSLSFVGSLELKDVELDNFEYTDNSPRFTFKNIIVGRFLVRRPPDDNIIISDCLISRLEHFSKEMDWFNSSDTNLAGLFVHNKLTTTDLSDSVSDRQLGVLMSILKKVMLQSGSGRQRTALYRGLDQAERSFVDPCIDALVKHEFVVCTKIRGVEIVLPDRSKLARVGKIMALPKRGIDPLVDEMLA
jgi:hypothetical protein